MPITLITGTPGSGKSLYAVNLLVNEYMKQDRKIFCDIDGLNIEGIESPPDDWRDAPKGSLLIYDEAQRRPYFDHRRRSRTVHDSILELDMHRHELYDFVLITQSPGYIKPQITELVYMHYHLHRPYGAPLSSIYMWRHAESKPQGRTAQGFAESNKLFRFDKSLFKLYKTADGQDSIKTKIPVKIIIFCLMPIILAFGVIHFAMKSSQVKSMVGIKESETAMATTDKQEKSFTEEQSEQIAKLDNHNMEVKKETSSTAPGATASVIQQPTTQNLELTRVAMIVDSSAGCRATNRWGDIIKMTQTECKQLSKQPYLSASYLNRDLPASNYQQQTAEVHAQNTNEIKAENVSYKPI